MKKIKKQYRKPQLTRVNLVAEEAVLTGCLKGTDIGPSLPQCSCTWMTCSSPGS